MVSGTASPSSHGYDRSLHGASYQELPEDRDREMATLGPRVRIFSVFCELWMVAYTACSFITYVIMFMCSLHPRLAVVAATGLLLAITPS